MIAVDFGVTISEAGLLVTLFALCDHFRSNSHCAHDQCGSQKVAYGYR